MNVVRNTQTVPVWVWKLYITHRSPGNGMEVLHKLHKFRVGIRMMIPSPGYCGTGVFNLGLFRVRVLQ